MIHDSLKNTKFAEKLHPLFVKAFAFIEKTDFTQLPDGKHIIEGDNLYAAISSITAKNESEAALETHNEYIDIQLPLLGVETIGWKAGNELKEVSAPYNPDNDITFFNDRPTSYTKIYPGEYAIYFPEDGHAPGIGEGSIRKVVVKVKK